MSVARYEGRVDGDTIVNLGLPPLIDGRRSFIFDGFEDNTNHTFEIRAVSGAGVYSAWTSQVDATTLEAFDPYNSSKLWMALEADTISGADGADVPNNTTWVDGSGNGHNGGIATAGSGFQIQTNEIGGHRALQFTTTDGTKRIYLPNMQGLTQAEIYIVWKLTDTAQNGGNSLGAGGATPLYPYVTDGDGKIYDDFGTSEQKNALTSQITILNTWHLLNIWSAPDDWGMYQNSLPVHLDATNTVAFSDNPQFGYNGTAGIRGLVACIFIFNAKLNTFYERPGMYAWLDAEGYI
jgi:hypothetical protein